MAGTLYCFNTVSDPRLYKLGHTQQDPTARPRGYMDPVACASSSRLGTWTTPYAGRQSLSLLRICTYLRPRRDLGTEWFEAAVDDVEERHRAIVLIMSTVAAAVRSTSSVPPSRQTSPVSSPAGPPPAMGQYFFGSGPLPADGCAGHVGHGDRPQTV